MPDKVLQVSAGYLSPYWSCWESSQGAISPLANYGLKYWLKYDDEPLLAFTEQINFFCNWYIKIRYLAANRPILPCRIGQGDAAAYRQAAHLFYCSSSVGKKGRISRMKHDQKTMDIPMINVLILASTGFIWYVYFCDWSNALSIICESYISEQKSVQMHVLIIFNSSLWLAVHLASKYTRVLHNSG